LTEPEIEWHKMFSFFEENIMSFIAYELLIQSVSKLIASIAEHTRYECGFNRSSKYYML